MPAIQSPVQSAALPNAASLLMAADSLGDSGADGGIKAQFAALLAELEPDQSAAPLPPQMANPGNRVARSSKDMAASGKATGKDDGKKLPDDAADMIAAGLELAASGCEQNDVESLGEGSSLEAASAATPTPSGPAQALLQLAAGLLRRTAEDGDPPANEIATAQKSAMPSPLPLAPAAPAARRHDTTPDTPAQVAAPATPEAERKPLRQAPVALSVPFAEVNGSRAENLASSDTESRPAAAQSKSAALQLPTLQLPTLQLLGESHAAANALAGVAPARKTAEPAADTRLTDKLAALTETATDMPASEIAQLPLSQPGIAPPALTAAGLSPSSPAQQHDFAALVDRLVEARQAVQSTLSIQTVEASVHHAEFGRVSLNFQQDNNGMTVTFANPDPDLARAVQSVAASASAGSAGTGSGSDSAANGGRQDWQNSFGQGAGQSGGQAQGQASSQRGAAPERGFVAAPGLRDKAPQESSTLPSAPRGGIFA
jgi:hypothetical protein